MSDARRIGRRMDRTASLAAALLATMTIGTMLVPAFSHHDPLAIGDVISWRLLPPFTRDATGTLHVLGTDRFGRDLFVRMMLAGRVSLAVGIGGSVLAAAIGTLVGAVAAWVGGVLERLAMAVADALLAIPRLVLLLVCAALWRPGLGTVVVVLAATGWMGVARIVRGEVEGVRERPFVDGAIALGVPGWCVLWKHVLPNIFGPVIVATTLGIGSAVLLESGLSFLGLGIQPPRPSWGNMIAGGRDLIVAAPWVSLVPGIALVLAVVASTLLGDHLRERVFGERTGTARTLAERT